jgi:hypothetical protein
VIVIVGCGPPLFQLVPGEAVASSIGLAAAAPLLGLVITAVNETAHRFFSKGPRPTNAMSETWNKAWAVCLVMMFLSSSLTLAGK